jgi:dihydroneopterin aldolase
MAELRLAAAADRIRRTTRVAVRNLTIVADIGIHAHEMNRRQPLVIAVELETAGADDDAIDATIDYRAIAAAAEALGDTRIALIESFAERLAAQCLAMPGVLAAAVTVDKPNALPPALASATVELRRER